MAKPAEGAKVYTIASRPTPAPSTGNTIGEAVHASLVTALGHVLRLLL